MLNRWIKDVLFLSLTRIRKSHAVKFHVQTVHSIPISVDVVEFQVFFSIKTLNVQVVSLLPASKSSYRNERENVSDACFQVRLK